jgi:N-methylhydantoinase B
VDLVVGGKALVPPSFALWHAAPSLLRIRSAGGGGFGDPLLRTVDQVIRDVRDEVVSAQAAAEFYGVVLQADGTGADLQATRIRRRALRDARRQPG